MSANSSAEAGDGKSALCTLSIAISVEQISNCSDQMFTHQNDKKQYPHKPASSDSLLQVIPSF